MLTRLLCGALFGFGMFLFAKKTRINKDIKWFFISGAVAVGLIFGTLLSLTIGSLFGERCLSGGDIEVLESRRVDVNKGEASLFTNGNSYVVLDGTKCILFDRDNLVGSGSVVFSNDEFVTLQVVRPRVGILRYFVIFSPMNRVVIPQSNKVLCGNVYFLKQGY